MAVVTPSIPADLDVGMTDSNHPRLSAMTTSTPPVIEPASGWVLLHSSDQEIRRWALYD